MKTSKKLLSFFLAVVMVVTTCSVGFTAFAQDNSKSIWSTSCEADDAFNTLNALADEYLPSALLGIESIGNSVYAKYAKLIGKDAADLTAHEKAVINGTEKATENDPEGLKAATVQDILGVLQPVLLNLLGTNQSKYANRIQSSVPASERNDASYYDYLQKDDGSMPFYSLYYLCEDYKDDTNLSRSTRNTLTEWYNALKPIANIQLVDNSTDTIERIAGQFDPSASILGANYSETYLYELEQFFTEEYMTTQVSQEDYDTIKASYAKYNAELQAYGVTDVTIDSFAKLVYYGFNKYGKQLKYVASYCNLIESTGTDISYRGTDELFDLYPEGYEYNITGPITYENYAELISKAYITARFSEAQITAAFGHGAADLTYDEAADLFADYFGLDRNTVSMKSLMEAFSLYGMANVILPKYEFQINEGLAIKYNDDINSVADIDALVAEIMPAGYKDGNVLNEDEIKEIASLLRACYNDQTTFFKNGSVTTEDTLHETVTATLPQQLKGTAVAEYFSMITGNNTVASYKNAFFEAFYSKFNTVESGKTWFLAEDGTPLVPNDTRKAMRYPTSNLPVLNYDGATYSVDKINEYIADAESYAYAKVIADLIGVDNLVVNSATKLNTKIDYKSFIESKNKAEDPKVVLDEEQLAILYGDYDLTGETGTEILNYILNSTVVSLLDGSTNQMVSDLINNLVRDLVGNIDLVATVENIWQRLYDSPVSTVFELLPVLVVIVDSALVPFLLNGEGDIYNGFITDFLDNLINLVPGIADYMYKNGSYIGINQIGWDLNELLPDLMHWLFDGKNADGIEYYDGSTKLLMTAVKVMEDQGDGTQKEVVNIVEKVFSYENCGDIDFAHYNVLDGNRNALTANTDENGAVISYSYLGETNADLKALLATHKDAEFYCYTTYSSDVPYLTGIYYVDQMLSYAKISDLPALVGDELGEVVTELATLFTAAIDEFVASGRVNQIRYAANGTDTACKGLNNLFVAIPQLFDIMEDLAADKYGVSKDAWTYCYDGKIVNDENKGYINTVVEEIKQYADSNDPNRSVDILDWFADLFVGDWINAILDLVNNVVSSDNKISQNIPIITGLLNSLGGFGETSILTDVFNGVFQIDRESEYSFTFSEHENGFTGLSKDNAYFLITNVETLVRVITNLVAKFGSSAQAASNNQTVALSDVINIGSTTKAQTVKASAAGNNTYTAEELSNATDLINNLDKMISSLLSDSSFNGFNLGSIDNILAGVVTFFTNYLGSDCYTELGRLLNKYTLYITGYETHTPDKNGNVDAKKVYTNESLTALVVETFQLIEDVAENLLADFYDTYTLDNGNKAQYNLIVEAIEGLISPDAIAIRLDGYDKVQEKLADFNCWHNAAAQTSRGDYKIKLDWGIKAGDKDAFYKGLASSLRLVSSIVGVLLIDTNWYETIVYPVLDALCTKNGVKVDTPAQYKATTNGYNDEALLGLIKPIAGFANSFLSKPVTTLIRAMQGYAGILDDKNGATIASILKGAITPIANEVKGVGNILGIDSDKLLATSPTLKATINELAETIMAYADTKNIKLGAGDKKYALSGTNLVPILNSYIAFTGISLKQINWNKLSTAKTPAAALVYVLEYVLDVLLDSGNLEAFKNLIKNDTFSMIIDIIKSSNLKAKDILALVDRILEATDSPTLAYWTFSQYLQEMATGFYYPAGITKQMADNGVQSLDDLVAGIFPLLSSFGVNLGGDNLQAILNKNLFTNDLITTLATALYGALDGLDPTIKEVLKSLGIVTSTKDVAKLLTDKSYGATYSSAAKTIKAQSSWKNVKNVNWGFKDGSAKAQQGFVNALAAVLRPLYNVLDVFLNEGTLKLNETAYNLICSLDIPYTVQILTISDSETAPIQCKVAMRMKDGVLRIKFKEYEGNREKSRSSELRLDFTSLKNLTDLKIEGTNGYNSAIIPLLEALQCGGISTYAQYQKDVAKAKDNLLLDVLNPLIGDSSNSFLNKLAAAPASELTKLLPNVAMYLDADGLVQLVCNLLAPVTDIVGFTGEGSAYVSEIIETLLGGSIQDSIIPIVNSILAGIDNKYLSQLELADINWNALISLGTKTTYTSKATGADGKFLTGKMVGNVDQGKVLISVLRYVANLIIDNASVLKGLICSIDGIAKSDKADMIISIITSVFNTISTASADQIVAAVFYLLAGQPENAFWDYTSYKTGKYSFTYPESVDVDFLKQLPPMLDGLIGGLADLNGLIGGALFKDELVSKLAKGLYGAIEGVKINDNLNLTQLLAQTNIDFSTGNVAKLLVDERYGQKFESAAATISAAGSWSKVNVDSLKWGVTDRDSFFHALVAVLRPLYGVLDVLLNDAYLGLFDIVRLPGSNGYTSSIVPLMEAFSMYNIKTQYQYRQDMQKEYDAILLDIINPIWDLVEDVLNAPLQTVAAIVPNLALFIGNNGLCQILDNLLTPISALADAIRPVVDLNDLLESLFSALNFDLNSILGKIGVTNFSLDVYDLNKTLKQIVGADNIIPLVNSILGMIKIKGTPLGLKLNAVDWLQLASHGTVVVSYSQAATYGARIFVQGDSSETLIAVLRYLIATVNTGDNFDKINNLIGGLLGDGASDSVSDMIGQVLGMLQGDTDEVIASLVDLLQSIA